MSVPLRLAAFALVLVVCFGAAYGVGAAVGPADDGGATVPHATVTTAAPDPRHSGEEHGG
jgi:hypothetical protein